MYFIQCYLPPEKSDTIEQLRSKHRQYIATRLSIIKYGGIVIDERGAMERICYFLQVSAQEEAENFLRADPYFPCYNNIEIRKFVQRIPQE
ncbi:MAG: hypothetical protein KatS3mg031_2003 [Chitinophagales bacterium]|nr:MAG: hypothetical protein KatS3mg031_2003 [Chitinophagales bacterium]